MTNLKRYCTLELPLHVNEGEKNAIDKKMECARKVYNNMLKSNLKTYNEMVKTRIWRELKSIVKEELQLDNTKKSNRLKDTYSKLNAIMDKNGFNEFTFKSQAVEYSKYYQKHLSLKYIPSPFFDQFYWEPLF